MSDAITVRCPACKASLNLKSRSAVGKRVPCPKCKKPFVVKAPLAEENDEMAFLNVSESDGAMEMPPEEEEEFAAALAPRSAPGKSARGAGKKGKAKPAASFDWVTPLLTGLAALIVIGLLGGGGYFVYALIDLKVVNKIDLTYLPPDADLVVHVRVDDVMNSPIMQSALAVPAVKQAIDKVASETHISPSDIKTITLGATGVSNADFSKLVPMPAMGMAGGGMPGGPAGPPGGAGPAGGSEKTRAVIVIRATKNLPAEVVTKIPGYEAATHKSMTYYRPSTPQLRNAQPVLCLAAPDVLIIADESEVQRIADNGPNQKRRAEFDFVETGPQIVIAMLQKKSVAGSAPGPGGGPSGAPGGGAPPAGGITVTPAGGGPPGGPGMPGMPGGGMPGGAPMSAAAGGAAGPTGAIDVPSLANGKLKAWYLGVSLTQDVEIQTGLYCPESATEARGEMERALAKAKTDFAANKDQQLAILTLIGLGELIPHIETMVNSVGVSGTGPVVQVTARIPGAIKSAFDKAIPALQSLAGGAPPGGLGAPEGFGDGNPFGSLPEGAADGITADSAGDATTAPGSQNPSPPTP